MVRLTPLLAALAMIAAPAAAAAAAPPQPVAWGELKMAGAYIDGVLGTHVVQERPDLSQRPTLPQVTKRLPPSVREAFSLSFNCAARSDGRLTDCRPVFATPQGPPAAAALTAAISPLVRVSRETARTMQAKAYRLTVDLTLDTVAPIGAPRPCLPPFCWVEILPPPKPPEPADDPVVAQAVERARTCFTATWAASGRLRFAAEAALRDAPDPGADPAVRGKVGDYVRSRQAMMACITDLQHTAAQTPASPHDRAVVDRQVKDMRFGYFG